MSTDYISLGLLTEQNESTCSTRQPPPSRRRSYRTTENPVDMDNRSAKRRKKNNNRSFVREEEVFGNNRIDDVRWLCSLTESELDFLISLKTLILRRAKVVGIEPVSENFDLKKLRVLSFTLMEYLKEQIKDPTTEMIEPEKSSACLEKSNLLRVEVCEKFEKMEAEELMGYLGKVESRGGLDEETESVGVEEMMGFVEGDGRSMLEEMFPEDMGNGN